MFPELSNPLLDQMLAMTLDARVVAWLPAMTWSDLGSSIAALMIWKWVADQIERLLARRLRVWLADSLVWLSAWIRPA